MYSDEDKLIIRSSRVGRQVILFFLKKKKGLRVRKPELRSIELSSFARLLFLEKKLCMNDTSITREVKSTIRT